MMKKYSVFICSFLLISISAIGQKPQKLTSNQLYEKLQKLNFLGTALYVAAHPDDENTRLIAYVSNKLKARTAYLSLTRGDGGQNLIGPEIRELLGVIRTQELLAARRIDGGEQLFSRANDFGYSKHPDETLKIWNKEKVLSDVVWAIRTFKPDVIINRFNHRTPGTTHGQHTSSAILSVEAFDLAGDKNQFPEQLKLAEAWKPKRLFFNTGSFFYRSQDEFKKATEGKLTTFDVGVYYPLKGLSNNELASMASSQHLCQGFGRLTFRGSQTEYVEFLKGDELKDKTDIFSGINTTWNRIKGGGEIGDILYDVEKNFDFVDPSKHITQLLSAYAKIQNLEDKHWRKVKSKQILELIEGTTGLYLEASAKRSSAIPGEVISIDIEALNRSTENIRLLSIKTSTEDLITQKNLNLSPNKRERITTKATLKTNVFSDPYWLRDSATLGMYTVDDQSLIGKPETPRPLQIAFHLLIGEQPVTIVKNVIYRYAERDKGEIYEPFEILPRVTTKLKDKVVVFSDDTAKKVSVSVRSGAANMKGEVKLQVPDGWKVSPNSTMISIEQKGDERTVDFMVAPSKNESEGKMRATVFINGKEYNKELVEINYDHIPKQSVLINSEAKVVRLNIKKAGNYIGYIKGAGDAVPESLQQIGYTIVEIAPEEINEDNLHKFDAVVLGVRAYNIVKVLKFKQKFLLEYVEKGGTIIVQYNTSRRVDVGAPYPLKLSRDRVTDEFAKVKILAKDHSVMNFPNKISEKDFEGWVQERGLYFPNEWSKEYTPILSMHDKGESAKEGSLLVAKYGKGHYIYTGLSFFRELPAGVPGAYKLFTNMLSIGKENIKTKSETKK